MIGWWSFLRIIIIAIFSWNQFFKPCWLLVAFHPPLGLIIWRSVTYNLHSELKSEKSAILGNKLHYLTQNLNVFIVLNYFLECKGATKKTFGAIFFCFKSTVKSDLTHVEPADPGRKAYEIILIPAYHTMLLETEKSEIISLE